MAKPENYLIDNGIHAVVGTPPVCTDATA